MRGQAKKRSLVLLVSHRDDGFLSKLHTFGTYTVHQYTRFWNDPKFSHEQAVKIIIQCLLRTTRNNGNRKRHNAKSWLYTLFSSFPVTNCFKFQTEIELSITESEYIYLSQSLKNTIPLIEILQELKKVILSENILTTVHYTIFEENKGCIDLVGTPCKRPRTTHIVLKYHNFRSNLRNETIVMQYVDVSLHRDNIFTKVLNDT